jgi:hypothetical protein
MFFQGDYKVTTKRWIALGIIRGAYSLSKKCKLLSVDHR